MRSYIAMDDFLDDEIGEKSKLLPDLLRALKKKEGLLQGQLSGIEADHEANEWQRVVADVRKTVSELNNVKSRCNLLTQETEGGEKIEKGAGSWLSEGGSQCVKKVEPLVKELVHVEQLQSYFMWMRRLHQICLQIESQMGSSSSQEVAVTSYFELCAVCSHLEKSLCSNLKQFAFSLKQNWGSRLRENLSNDFSSVLKEIKWPFVSSAGSSKQTEIWKKHEKKFSKLFGLLLKLDDGGSSRSPLEGFRKISLGEHVILPLELLLSPLRKRFKYHFSGNRKTNSKEKPEWYFTQVSGWIGDHTYFLENNVQPLLDNAECSHIDARLEFIRGLLQEVEAKLLHDLPLITHDDDLMAHSIDELLLFERELRTVYQYCHPSPSILHVLLDEVRFHKWLTLEKTYAVERLHSIIKSETAWEPAYNSVDGADDTLVPECTEGFMVLIKGIEERYKPLLSIRHQLQFLDLQRDLLLEFHQDLGNNWAAVSASPLVPQAAAYLNSANYIATVLKQWGETEFFLELQHYLLTTAVTAKGDIPPSTETEGVTSRDLSPIKSRLPFKSIQFLREQDKEFASLLGTAFDSVIEAFTSLVKEMESSLVQFLSNSVKTKCYGYKQEKWHSLKPIKDELSLDITSSAAQLIATLRHHLSFIELHISPTLTMDVLETLATRIDKLLLTEVVLGSSGFSDGGAQQLQLDVTKVLVPLLAKYCHTVPRKQLMERTKEACILLQLSAGSARLTQDLLQAVARPRGEAPINNDTYEAAVASLNEMAVHTLDPTEAERILKLRIFPPQQ